MNWAPHSTVFLKQTCFGATEAIFISGVWAESYHARISQVYCRYHSFPYTATKNCFSTTVETRGSAKKAIARSACDFGSTATVDTRTACTSLPGSKSWVVFSTSASSAAIGRFSGRCDNWHKSQTNSKTGSKAVGDPKIYWGWRKVSQILLLSAWLLLFMLPVGFEASVKSGNIVIW